MQTRAEAPTAGLPPLSQQINLDDFEKSAERYLAPKAWAYYSSAGDDLLSKAANTANFRKILLRPRIFRDITRTDTRTTLLDTPSALPIFIAPAALAKLAHPSGEMGICAAAGKAGIIQCLSTNASMTPEKVSSARTSPSQRLWFQLYVNTDRRKTEALLSRVRATRGFSAVVVTLDASWPGKREADERLKNAVLPEDSGSEITGTGGGDDSAKQGGLARALFQGTAGNLTWDEVPWLVACSGDMPLVLKGVQTYEDVVLAANTPGIKGVVLSNHGGRALDTAPDACLTLLELRRYCPEVFSRLEIYIDGGVRRGTDVVKALCLGAKAVGIGRPALFGLSGYGEAGVGRVIQILREEVETCMKLLGVNKVEELGPQYVRLAVYTPCVNTKADWK